MQQHVAGYQKTISKQDEEFSVAQQDLQRQQAILTQDAFATKVKEFEQRIGDARKKAQELQQHLAESQREAYAKVELEMLQIVANLAKEHNANLVLNKSTVLMFDTKFELTDEVIKRLDEKLPSVTVSFNRSGQQSAPGTPPTGSPKPASGAPKKKS